MAQAWHRVLLRTHRGLGLAFVALWVLQAFSGTLLVFHRDLDDLAAGQSARPLDVARFAMALDQFEAERGAGAVESVYLTSLTGRHYDVRLAGGGLVRLDGEGTEVLRRPVDSNTEAFWLGLNRMHRSLFAGEWGERLIRVSGALLLTNLAVGLRLAWPAPSRWREAIAPPIRGRPASAATFGAHRALGLVLALPALVLVGSGTLMSFERPVLQQLGPAIRSPAASQSFGGRGFHPLLAAGDLAMPQARLTAVIPPFDPEGALQLRYLAPGDLHQAHGEARVYLDPATAEVLAIYRPADGAAVHRLFHSLFPIHTGQAGGWLGRSFAMLVGVWLLAMAALGVRLWRLRRVAAQPAPDRRPCSPSMRPST